MNTPDVTAIRAARKQKWVAIVLAFGDESHDERRERVFSVAALVGRQCEWDTLEEKWLRRTGGNVFHAADCDSNQGDYKHTANSENKALYEDLTRLLAESRLFGYAHSLDLIGQQAVFGETLLPEASYYFCFARVVGDCARNSYLSIPQETVKFTFDLRRETALNAARLYEYAVNLPEWEHRALVADEIGFMCRDGAVGIQAADLVAREAMKELDSRIGPRHFQTRLSFMTLLKSRRFKFRYYMREYLEGLRERVNNDPTWSREKYGEWLSANRITSDTVDTRLRWFTYLDAVERQKREPPDRS